MIVFVPRVSIVSIVSVVGLRLRLMTGFVFVFVCELAVAVTWVTPRWKMGGGR